MDPLSGKSGAPQLLAAGAVLFAAGCAWLAAGSDQALVLLPAFVLAGLGIGRGETAQSAAAAILAPEQLRGSAFGLLATVQSAGDLIASAVAGLLWTAISPAAAFTCLGAAMAIAAALILTTPANPRPGRQAPPAPDMPGGTGRQPARPAWPGRDARQGRNVLHQPDWRGRAMRLSWV